MTNTQQNQISDADILNAAKRVIKETRPEEIELMDEAELEAYLKSKQIIREHYSKKRSSR